MCPFFNSDPAPGQGTNLMIGARAVYQPPLTPQLGAFVQGRARHKVWGEGRLGTGKSRGEDG